MKGKVNIMSLNKIIKKFKEKIIKIANKSSL